MASICASSEFWRDPHRFYPELRRSDPVHHLRRHLGRNVWLVTRYADVAIVLRDDQFSNSFMDHSLTRRMLIACLPWYMRPLLTSLLDDDGCDHKRLRAILKSSLMHFDLQGTKAHLFELCNSLLNGMHGSFELVSNYAAQVPLALISEIIGIPFSMRRTMHRSIIGIIEANHHLYRLPKLHMHAKTCMNCIMAIVADRKTNLRNDLISALIRKESEGELSQHEILSLVYFLFLGGQVTTADLISGSVLALCQYPTELERLQNQSLSADLYVDELLRFVSPTHWAAKRVAKQDVSVSGTLIRQGDLVYAAIASANRDPEFFMDPERLDLSRRPNRHLAFGMGKHFCIGNQLARLELEIAISTLISKFPSFELANSNIPVRWRKGHLLRGPSALHMRVATP